MNIINNGQFLSGYTNWTVTGRYYGIHDGYLNWDTSTQGKLFYLGASLYDGGIKLKQDINVNPTSDYNLSFYTLFVSNSLIDNYISYNIKSLNSNSLDISGTIVPINTTFNLNNVNFEVPLDVSLISLSFYSVAAISNYLGNISMNLIPNPISNICFPAGTPINTDQGIIPIEKINPDKCTIRGNKIETITKTVTQDNYLVCIEKDALAKNIPSQKTLISKNHKLFYNGNMIESKDLLKMNNNGIYKVKYNGEILYNVLLQDGHDKMIVNNLICETLDPKNSISKMHLDLKNANLTNELKEIFIKNYNEHVTTNKIFK